MFKRNIGRVAIVTSTVITMLAYFFLSKLVASRYGVQGMALFGVMLAISSLFVLLGDLNVGPEFLKRLALSTTRHDSSRERSELVGTVIAITLVVTTTLMVLVLLISRPLALALALPQWSIIAAGFVGAITVIAQQCFHFLSGYGLSSRMALASSFRAIATFLLAMAAINLGSASLPSAYLIGQIGGGTLAVAITAGTVPKMLVSRDPRYLKDLLRAGIAMTGTLVAYFGVLFTLPLLIQFTSGSEINGLMKSGLLISGSLLQLVNSLLRFDFLPRLSAVSSTSKALTSIQTEARLLLSLFGVMAFITVLARPIIWPILLTDDFAAMAGPLIWILVGDLQRVLIAAIGYSLFSLTDTKFYFLLESLGGISLLFSVWLIAVNSDSTLPIAVAYAIAHTPVVVAALGLAKLKIGLKSAPGLFIKLFKICALILLGAGAMSIGGWLSVLGGSTVLLLLCKEVINEFKMARTQEG